MGRRNVSTRSRIGMTTVEMGAPAHDPEDAPFAQPQREGDDRPAEPSPLQRLLDLPREWLNLAHVIESAVCLVTEALGPQVWSALTALSNVPQKGTFGTGCYLFAYDGHPSQALELRNLLVGTSAPGIVQLVAVRAADLIGSSPPYRVLATVRTTASALTLFMPAKLRLEPEERLALIYLTTTAVTFDLSGEYRVLRS